MVVLMYVSVYSVLCVSVRVCVCVQCVLLLVQCEFVQSLHLSGYNGEWLVVLLFP